MDDNFNDQISDLVWGTCYEMRMNTMNLHWFYNDGDRLVLVNSYEHMILHFVVGMHTKYTDTYPHAGVCGI